MTNINFFGSPTFTINNEGIKELNKVLFDSVFKYGKLFNTCAPLTGVTNGEKVGYVTKMNDVGWKENGDSCTVVYKDPSITGREDAWALGEYKVPLKLCYKKLQSTIAKYSLRTGTDIADLIGTEFWDKIFMPLLSEAVNRMYWRIVWFGDTAAATVTDSNPGTITDGVDTDLFKIADGFWKRIFGIIASSPKQVSYMTADGSANGTALNLMADGVATDYVDKLLGDANSLIKDGKLYMTKSFLTALRRDYRRTYKATIPFMEVAEGFSLPSYDGTPIIEVPEWDSDIHEFHAATANNVTTYDKPNRVLFMNPENFLVGTSDKNVFGYFDTWFSKDDQDNKTLLRSDVGTFISDPSLFQAGF